MDGRGLPRPRSGPGLPNVRGSPAQRGGGTSRIKLDAAGEPILDVLAPGGSRGITRHALSNSEAHPGAWSSAARA